MPFLTPARQQKEKRNEAIIAQYQRQIRKGSMKTAVLSHLAQKYGLSQSSIQKITQILRQP
ncbi:MULTISPECIES: hypothetical protein [unclassified Spirosoma]|uniref:hypothetical protein n=1 Tax=unclassified Spirosoma TaxID=2621999 RepID=UPI00095F43B4|nr:MULTISPECIES: hypothetical protein [unclassified Spirosoma]MBN8821317.1 hypothetical protein [Spirosoma sp.]OJW78105.1 MAG: hypothetical protein BGO59_29235 [Spirosoma sp. 48-14]